MFGALFSYVAASSFIYINQFGVDQSLFGFYFSANIVSMLIGTFTNGRIVERFGYRTLLGVAVDNGIHLVTRHRAGLLPDGNVLKTATARARNRKCILRSAK